MRPRFSVVIPCLDEAATLRACLDALAAQDLPRASYEVVVVDGGSTDGSQAIVRDRGFRLLRDAKRGPGAARNLGIRETTGEIVVFTDADCVPRPDWLSRLAEVFDSDPGIDGVAGAMRLPRGTLLGRMEDNDARLHYRGFITSNVAYRRAALEAVGGFDGSLLCCEDYDLAWRLLDAGHRIVHDAGPVVLHAPPEISGGVGTYLAKQFWYARHDVPAHLLALSRARRDADARAGSSLAAVGGLQAMAGVAIVAGLVGASVLRRPALAAAPLAALLVGPLRDAVRGVRRVGGEPGDAARIAAVAAAKRVVRGVGTAVGLAESLGRLRPASRGAAPRSLPRVRAALATS